MSEGLQFDEETSRKVEALYLTPDVVAQRYQTLKVMDLQEGERGPEDDNRGGRAECGNRHGSKISSGGWARKAGEARGARRR
jgi:hypothetical protein